MSAAKKELEIHLLGEFRVVYREALVTALDTPRLQSFLAYLLLHRGAPQTRQHLAFLFWPDSAEAQARTNLRKLVHRLRRSLPEAERFLSINGRTLGWRPEATYWLDVSEFENVVAQFADSEELTRAPTALEEALALYQGDLLPSCYDDWIQPQRERLSQAFRDGSEHLIAILDSRRDYGAAIRHAQRLIRHDPLHEGGYRSLMRLSALNGDRASALRAYHTCVTVLERELAVEPSSATREAYEHLVNAPEVSTQPRKGVYAAAPLVGRKREWAQLQGAWRTAAAGAPRLAVIGGEAGIGKSRLAEELLGWAARQGIQTASARCYAAEGGLAYAPVAAWLRASSLACLDSVWLTEVSRLLSELITERPDLPRPDPLEETWQRQRFFEALARAILVGGRPSLLFIDDLQWCDQETLEWLHYLLRFDPRAPILVVGTMRLEAMENDHPLESLLRQLRQRGHLTEIELGPLGRAETISLAGSLVSQELSPTTADRLYEETEGNPLFVVEMARASTQPQSEEEIQRLPSRVQAVITERLAQLSPSARELVGVAATIGRDFSYPVLARASGGDQERMVCALDELWARRIVREQGVDAYDFSHDKIRDVAYTGLSAARRRLLHRRVAQALEELNSPTMDRLPDDKAAPSPDLDAVIGQIAAHFEQAGLLDRALPGYVRAANHAVRLYAYRKADALYARAIDVALRLKEPGLRLTALHSARGRTLEMTGRYQEAIDLYRELEALAHQRNDRVMECAAVARLVTAYIKPNDTHSLELAQPLIEHGLGLAREIGDPDLESRLLWSKMVRATHYGNMAEAQAAGDACIAVARKHNLRERLAFVLHDLSINLRLNGKMKRGTESAKEAQRLFHEQGNRPLLADNLNQQGLFDCLHLKFEDALQRADKAGQISQEINNPWNLAYAAMVRGMVQSASGDWGKAQADYEESIYYGRKAGFLMALTFVLADLGRILREVGQVERAVELHRDALSTSERMAPFMLQAIEAQMAMDTLASGDHKEVRGWLHRAEAREPLGDIGASLALTYPADAAVNWAALSGEWERSLELVERLNVEARQRRLLLHLPHLALLGGRCLEGLGQTADAEARYRDALDAATPAGMRPVMGRAHAALGRIYRSQGRAAEADMEEEESARLAAWTADTLADPTQRRSYLASMAGSGEGTVIDD